MLQDLGFLSAVGQAIPNPMPISWLGRPDVPTLPPSWANIGTLTNVQLQSLQAQIAYDKSGWNLSKIGANDELGYYQITPAQLEYYGLLVAGAVNQYGSDAVNYRNAWQPTYIRNSSNPYAYYFYDVPDIDTFLITQVVQDHLAYQRINDIYLELQNIGAIKNTDTNDVVAGMVYVAWDLGVGKKPTRTNPSGTGAYAWRFFNKGNGIANFNSGRYALQTLI